MKQKIVKQAELLELGQARRALGQKAGEWTEAQNNRLVGRMDTDGDGTISGSPCIEQFQYADIDCVLQWMSFATFSRRRCLSRPQSLMLL